MITRVFHALDGWLVFLLSFHWLPRVFPFLWLAVVMTFLLVLECSIEKRSSSSWTRLSPFFSIQSSFFSPRAAVGYRSKLLITLSLFFWLAIAKPLLLKESGRKRTLLGNNSVKLKENCVYSYVLDSTESFGEASCSWGVIYRQLRPWNKCCGGCYLLHG